MTLCEMCTSHEASKQVMWMRGMSVALCNDPACQKRFEQSLDALAAEEKALQEEVEQQYAYDRFVAIEAYEQNADREPSEEEIARYITEILGR